MSEPLRLVLMDFSSDKGLLNLCMRQNQHHTLTGLSLVLVVVFRKTKDRLHKALIVVSSSITGMIASLAFGVEPSDVMDSLRAATALVVQQLFPAVCMGIVLLQR